MNPAFRYKKLAEFLGEEVWNKVLFHIVQTPEGKKWYEDGMVIICPVDDEVVVRAEYPQEFWDELEPKWQELLPEFEKEYQNLLLEITE